MNDSLETPDDRFHELLGFVRFGSDDRALLVELADHARPDHERMATLFYERARGHEDAQAVFESEAQIEQLHHALVDWLEHLLGDPRDAASSARAATIGRVHVRVGLPQRYMFAAMNLVRTELGRIAWARMPDRAPAALEALGRVLDVELAIMTQSYAAAQVALRTRAFERQKNDDTDALRLESAIEHADELIVGFDAAGAILLFNRAAQRTSGYALEEVIGEPFGKLMVPDDDARFEACWRAALTLAPGAEVDLECTLRKRTGKLLTLAGRLCRHHQPDELAVFLLGRDVSHARAVEAQLRRSEKLAAVGTLAAGLAHEIRNPLNGALLHLTFLRRALVRDDGAAELVAAADVVSEEIRRLGDLVSEFLEFARPQPLHRKPTSVQELCRRCLALVADVAATQRVEIVPMLPPGTISAEIDGAKMEQVLLNLLRNAIEAMSTGGTATLTALRRPRHVAIEVEDTGAGIAADAPIWDAFYSTKEGGTGLGLAIAHRIVSDHGGAISVESRPGRTVFRVEVPLTDPERPPVSLRPGFEKGKLP